MDSGGHQGNARYGKYGLITTRTTNSVKGTTGTTGRTEYFTSQGRPPVTNQKGCKTQSKIQDFFKPTTNS
eukprot:5086284-Ditylum_brightwellii.AAC.1